MDIERQRRREEAEREAIEEALRSHRMTWWNEPVTALGHASSIIILWCFFLVRPWVKTGVGGHSLLSWTSQAQVWKGGCFGTREAKIVEGEAPGEKTKGNYMRDPQGNHVALLAAMSLFGFWLSMSGCLFGQMNSNYKLYVAWLHTISFSTNSCPTWLFHNLAPDHIYRAWFSMVVAECLSNAQGGLLWHPNGQAWYQNCPWHWVLSVQARQSWRSSLRPRPYGHLIPRLLEGGIETPNGLQQRYCLGWQEAAQIQCLKIVHNISVL